MIILRAILLFRDFNFIYKFNSKSDKPIWDIFYSKIETLYHNCYIEKQSTMQQNYYIYTENRSEDVSAVLRNMLHEIISEETDNYFIAVKEISSDEIKQILVNDNEDINKKTWFQKFSKDMQISVEPDSLSSSEVQLVQQESSDEDVKETENVDSNTEVSVEKQKVKSSTEENSVTDKENDSSNENLVLSKEINKLLAHKQALLDKVKGQRHAIEEVLNTVFECDAFTSKNENREGPLASFLFTGPSGVGKTFLAKQCGKLLGRKCKIVDMSEYSDNLSHGKFNGDYNQRAEVTSFIRENPNGIIVFDEIEKAHINTIHLFLQILDEGHLTDVRLNKKISFKDAIIIITTNAGKSLYDDTTVYNLSSVPRKVILDGLRKDINPQTNEPYFPDCIVTRFANGHVILFNHLEPYALMEIVKDEIALQVELFQKSFDINVNYDPTTIAALAMYAAGGASDARTLRGIARRLIVSELQECVIQTYKQIGDNINKVKNIELCIDIDTKDVDISNLFAKNENTTVAVFSDDATTKHLSSINIDNIEFIFCNDISSFKKCARKTIDLVLIDPLAGQRTMERKPHDIEDIQSDGIDMFTYFFTHYSEIPTYVLDTKNCDKQVFDSLLKKGAKGVVGCNDEEKFVVSMNDIVFHSHINNSVFSLSRSGKALFYNSYQYNVDDETVIVVFSRLALDFAKSSDDDNILTLHDKDNGVTFDDVIGCKSAKEALKEFCDFASNQKSYIAKGKHIPRGVLLYGPPGTGKTMLAKAMANEANVAFIPVTATSFFGPLVGEIERNIREVFRKARKYAPSIIFVDEVDAIARRRTGDSTTSHYENALNAFIAEMEGFSSDEKRPVLIIAATNYDIGGASGRVLDEAFVRRFDKRIFVDLPDKDARYKFFEKKLKYHEINFGDEHERILENLAQRTSGSSNSDLDKIVAMFVNSIDEEAPPSATVLMDMIDAFRFGEVNKVPEDSQRQTAYHESGHALIHRILGSTPLYLTIVSRGNFGGYMEHQHEDFGGYTYEQLMKLVCCSLAGRIAEIEVFGNEAGLNTGASQDLDSARKYIKAALDDYGMGEKLYTKSDDETGERIIKEQYARTEKLIKEHRHILDKLAELLLEHKSLDEQQLDTFFKGEGI